MPTMANITVKKKDGTTDIVWTAAQPSAGSGTPAVWRSNTVSSILGFRPKFQLNLRDNAAKNGRVLEASLDFPVIDSVTNLVTARVPLRVNGTLPTNVPVADVEEAFAQFGNLLVSTLIRASTSEGYAPT